MIALHLGSLKPQMGWGSHLAGLASCKWIGSQQRHLLLATKLIIPKKGLRLNAHELGRKHMQCTHTPTHTHAPPPTHPPTHPRTHERLHARTHARTHAPTQARRHAGTQARRHAGTQARTHARAHTHTHTHRANFAAAFLR